MGGRQHPTWRRRCRRVGVLEAPALSMTEGWALRSEGRKPKGGLGAPARPPPVLRRERRSRLSQSRRAGREARGRERRAPRPHPTRFQYFAERHAAPNRSFPG